MTTRDQTVMKTTLTKGTAIQFELLAPNGVQRDG